MVDRRVFLIGAGALATTLPAIAQQPGRIYRVGALTTSPWDAPQYGALREELAKSGFIDGGNLVIERQGFGLRQEQFVSLAVELVSVKVDVILAAAATAIRAALQATKTIPIIGLSDDMVAEGLVSSLPRPGGNVTGVSGLASELDAKRQELLGTLIAPARRIAALADAATLPPSKAQFLRDAAQARGIQLTIHAVRALEEIAPAIEAAKAEGADGLNVLATPLFFSNRTIVSERVAALALPAMYQWPQMAHEGGLVAYGPSIVEIYRTQLARMIIRLLLGASPADIPVEQPARLYLVINRTTASTLGLTVPPPLLAGADEVIE